MSSTNSCQSLSCFCVGWQGQLLEIGFNGSDIFKLKSSFEEFRRRNQNITSKQVLINDFTNQLPVHPPTNMSKINKAFVLMMLGNTIADIRHNTIAQEIPVRPNFPLFQNPEQRQQYYQNIVDNIMRNVAANSPQENATTSLINAGTSLNNAATIGDATSLNDAANSLAVAANLMYNQQHHSIVFVYDIDEISVISMNLISEFVILYPEIRASYFMELMFQILNCANFRGRELHDGIANIGDIAENGPVSDKYMSLKLFYEQMSRFGDRGLIISDELIDRCGMTSKRDYIFQVAERFQQRWQNAKKCLELVNQKSRESENKYSNVVISKDRFEYGATQLLISGLSSEIPIDNIYSIDGPSKDFIFNRIQQRFGEKCVLVYVTLSSRISSVPLKPHLHVWPVESSQSLITLFNAQRDVLLR